MKNEFLDFLNKAKENLTAATLLFENELYNALANRAYYAAFQAAVAALANIGIETVSHSHEATQAHFAAELIKRRKIYPSHLKSYLMDLQRIRNRFLGGSFFITYRKNFRRETIMNWHSYHEKLPQDS